MHLVKICSMPIGSGQNSVAVPTQTSVHLQRQHHWHIYIYIARAIQRIQVCYRATLHATRPFWYDCRLLQSNDKRRYPRRMWKLFYGYRWVRTCARVDRQLMLCYRASGFTCRTSVSLNTRGLRVDWAKTAPLCESPCHRNRGESYWCIIYIEHTMWVPSILYYDSCKWTPNSGLTSIRLGQARLTITTSHDHDRHYYD